MPSYELQFAKEGEIKYTSHLDLMRLFRRAFKRAGVDLVYSHGFNPHPRMSAALPLPLGCTSICEWIDFKTHAEYEPDTIRERLQAVMPEGIRLITCRKKDGKKTLASRCRAASYIIAVTLPAGRHLTPEDAEAFLARDTIMAERPPRRRRKKKQKAEAEAIDIRGRIRELTVYQADDKLFLSTTLDAGSQSNLNPELLLRAFLSWADLPWERENVEILRRNIYFAGTSPAPAGVD
ncbi:MAG: TIGR03936 family radical SAM-associated protein [Anaerovoracaceae bacterium]|jgi:radical SAM-linked protein